jgi:DNA-binding transcriptional regulator GbsR (MarR family)
VAEQTGIRADSGPAVSAETVADGAPSVGAQTADGVLPADSAQPADGQPQRDPAAVRAFIERFTALLTLTGFPRTPARIFVALLTSDSSKLTAAELAELLRTSPASVSGGVRYLLQVGLITAAGERGSRRLHYQMSADVWQDIVGLRASQFTRWAAELRQGVEVLGAGSPAGGRMAATVNYFEFISDEITDLLARWDERKDASQARHTDA